MKISSYPGSTDRSVVAHRTASKLRAFSSRRAEFPVMIGFDGFIDSIIAAVEKRFDASTYQPIEMMEQFGRKILDAAGKNANYEFVVKRRKLGGNGPILANALATLGLPVTFIGAIGYPQVDPVFSELAARADCLSIANPGFTDAIEFNDGKLLLGKYEHLEAICWSTLCDVVGEQRFYEIVSRSRLIGMVNWTLLSRLDEIWQQMIERVLPTVTNLTKLRRLIFVDLADPEKRTLSDLQRGLARCTAFSKYTDVVLGMNFKEAAQVAAGLGIATAVGPELDLAPLSQQIRSSLQINGVVIHSPRSSSACLIANEREAVASFASCFTDKPQISTGAGDSFNSGFCLGLLAELTVNEALCVGTATAGYYVRNASAPTLEQLVEFVELLRQLEN